MNNQMMWIAVIIALLVGAFGGYSYEKSKLTNQMMMGESAMQKQLDDMKMKNDQLMKTQMMQPSPAPTGMMMHTMTPTGAMMGK